MGEGTHSLRLWSDGSRSVVDDDDDDDDVLIGEVRPALEKGQPLNW